MNHERFEVKYRNNIYVRLPENLSEENEMKLIIPKELAGKTLKISVLDTYSREIPFSPDAISGESSFNVLCYFGDDSYWKPEEFDRVVVEGNPDCDYVKCDGNCHDVSCQVHQGFASGDPVRIRYIRSARKN